MSRDEIAQALLQGVRRVQGQQKVFRERPCRPYLQAALSYTIIQQMAQAQGVTEALSHAICEYGTPII